MCGNGTVCYGAAVCRKVNSALAVIYEHMLYKDMIDEKTAAILPRVLCSSRVKCENSAMKYVIVRCEELGGEEAFLLENGEAYVPVVSKNTVLFFQDTYGWPLFERQLQASSCYG